MKRFKALILVLATFVMLAMASLASFPWDVSSVHF
jgi:hypothetical protein